MKKCRYSDTEFAKLAWESYRPTEQDGMWVDYLRELRFFFSSFFFLPIRALQTVCTNSRLFFWGSEFVSTNLPRRLCGLRRFSVLSFFLFFTLSLCPRTDHVFVASLWTKCTKTWLVHVFVHQADFLFFFPLFFLSLSFTHARTCIYTHTSTHIHACIHTYTHTHIHTYAHTYIHAYTHTNVV